MEMEMDRKYIRTLKEIWKDGLWLDPEKPIPELKRRESFWSRNFGQWQASV